MRLCRSAVLLTAFFPFVATHAAAQRSDADRLIDAALHDSAAYGRLALLVDTFGNRFSGSSSLEHAIDWITDAMRKDGLQNVHTEPVMVTHWVRGRESAMMLSPRRAVLPMLGLGRSVGTPAAGITAPVLVVHDFADLRAHASEAKGRIVVYDFPFSQTKAPFEAYGEAVQYRGAGADSAALFGARAVLVRSVTPHSLRTPHTGAMFYGDTSRGATHLPAAAITVEDAQMLQRLQERGVRAVVHLVMSARTLAPAPSRNIVAELRGSEHPEQIVVLGGHIDSWDVGQGAMDDGGGAVAAWEALRLMKQLGISPKRTVRVVLWTNEEIGLAGGRGYARAHTAEIPDHVAALESDNGVFRPVGIRYTAPDAAEPMLKAILAPLARLGVNRVASGGPEADVSPLNAAGVPALALDIDASRYFWYHHTDADTIDKLDPDEMARCVATMGVVALGVANAEQPLPRAH